MIADGPSGPSRRIVEQADQRQLRALDNDLWSAASIPDHLDRQPSLWLTNSSEDGVSTVIVLPDATILSVGAIRREPRVITVDGADAIVARSVAALTLSYRQSGLDRGEATKFLRTIAHTIQTRDWSIEL